MGNKNITPIIKELLKSLLKNACTIRYDPDHYSAEIEFSNDNIEDETYLSIRGNVWYEIERDEPELGFKGRVIISSIDLHPTLYYKAEIVELSSVEIEFIYNNLELEFERE